MDEIRTKCEIITSSISDTEWMESILEKQENIFVRRYDYGSGRELLIVFERIKDCWRKQIHEEHEDSLYVSKMR